MTISEFSISSDKSKLDLTITDAADARVLRLWTDKTYKDFTVAIDLTAKLTGAATENIVITLADIGIPYFDGLYFIEVEDSDEIAFEYTSELTRFDECITNRLGYISSCNECLDGIDEDLLNAHMYLEGLEKALENRYIDDILLFFSVLDKYCDNECNTCGKRSVVDSTTEDTVGSSTITIKLDGGSLD